MKIVKTQRANTQKVEKPELWFMCSACRLMVFNVCVKFHENMSSFFKVMERTRKLLTDTQAHTQKRRKHYTPMAYFVCHYIPMAYFVCRGYNNNMFCFSSYKGSYLVTMYGKSVKQSKTIL